MLALLYDRYDSNSTASNISKISELVPVRYTSLGENMAKHIDQMAGIIDQLRSMGTKFEDPLAIGILVASIEEQQLKPATAAIKTLAESDLNRGEVSGRLIEEVKTLLKASDSAVDSHAAYENWCHICERNGHSTGECFSNPKNPQNRLGLNTSTVSDGTGGINPSGRRKGKWRGGRGRSSRFDGNSERSSMDRTEVKN